MDIQCWIFSCLFVLNCIHYNVALNICRTFTIHIWYDAGTTVLFDVTEKRTFWHDKVKPYMYYKMSTKYLSISKFHLGPYTFVNQILSYLNKICLKWPIKQKSCMFNVNFVTHKCYKSKGQSALSNVLHVIKQQMLLVVSISQPLKVV